MNNLSRKENGAFLFAKFREGNIEAMEKLHALYYNTLLQYGMAIVSDRDLVKDVIQDLFLWLLKQKDKKAPIRDMDLYLFTALRQNLMGSVAHLEDRRSRHEHFYRHSPTIISLNQEDKLIREEQNEKQETTILSEINRLPQRQREVLLLRFYNELSYRQIAALLAITNQAARNTTSRALKTLRRQAGHLRNRVSLWILLLSMLFWF